MTLLRTLLHLLAAIVRPHAHDSIACRTNQEIDDL